MLPLSKTWRGLRRLRDTRVATEEKSIIALKSRSIAKVHFSSANSNRLRKISF